MFRELIIRRGKGEPIAYLIGSREFYGLQIEVSPGTFIPRPETELVVELALDWLSRHSWGHPRVVVDVGTGSGAIVLAIWHSWPDARFAATDLSRLALAQARRNATAMKMPLPLAVGNLLDPIASESCDLITSNPPYLDEHDISALPTEISTHEPLLALDGGHDGMALIRRLIASAHRCLRQGGLLLFEIGCTQGRRAATQCKAVGFKKIEIKRDLAGLDRVVVAHKIS